MLKLRHFAWHFALVALTAFQLAAGQTQAASANRGNSAPNEQHKLILVLQSGAAPEDKAIACKKLAIYGTRDAVPALAALLSDARLASWARIALEAIPDPAADAALRQAMGQLQGSLLVGTINSIGARADVKAEKALENKLKDADPEIASASAAALGRIGGKKASKALVQALNGAASGMRPAVAEGCILCAEKFMDQGMSADAVKVYDAVRKTDVPRQKMLEATRGAILARQSAGLPLLLELLRSSDRAMLNIGLSTARELPGPEVTAALARELPRAGASLKPLLLLALAERGDPAALPTILEAAKTGSPALQLTAIGVLDRLGDPGSVPVLLAVAVDGAPEVAQAAVGALSRLSGENVDADICARLQGATPKIRKVLIELATQRRIERALPAIVACAEDADAGVRAAAFQAIGALGAEKEAARLANLLPAFQSAGERADIGAALVAISARKGAGCVPDLLVLARSQDSALRIIGLHALASAGGGEALAAVSAAVADKDEAVQDEAVRILSTWPNNWPEDSRVAEPLLTLARSGKKTSHKVLGLRGYLQFIQGDKQLKDEEKLARIGEVLPLAERPEEQRLAIAVVSGIPNADALGLLITLAAQPAVADDACAAAVELAGNKARAVSADQRRKALQTVVEKSGNEGLKKKAEELLKAMP